MTPLARRFRLRARSGRSARAIWINIPFTFTASETAAMQLLVAPEDWESQFSGLANEKATLRAVRGELGFAQLTTATVGTPFFFGLCALDSDATVAPNFTVAGMSDADWITTGCIAAQGSASSANNLLALRQVEVKAKRRLTSRTAIYITAQFGADATNNPTLTVTGLLRFLVARG